MNLTQQDIDQANALWRVQLVKINERFNPNHEPAGSPIGGEFAPASGGGLLTDDKELQNLAKDSSKSNEFFAKLDEKRAQFVIDKGKAIVDSILARNPAIQEKLDAVKHLSELVDKNNVLVDKESKWFQDYWAKPAEERPDKGVFKDEEVKFEKIMEEGLEVFNAKTTANRDFTETLTKELRMEGVPGGHIDVNTGVKSSTAGQHVELLIENPSVPLAMKSFEKFTGAVGKVNAFTTDHIRSYFADTQVPDAGDHANAGTVWFSPNVGQATVWHEMGHWLEQTTLGGQTAASSFLKYRTKGEDTASLSGLTHDPGYANAEIAAKDKFMEAYTGKIYNGGSTEITSMGMQHMQEDPAMFYRLDPEHFNFTLGMIQGRKEGGFKW